MTTPSAKFCTSCGTPLAAGARFCGECGAPVVAAETVAPGPATPPAATMPMGERRQVTVLFADLSGFTALSKELDPEELHELMGRVFSAIDGLVADYGGTVDKHIGDAVMGLFGAPVAHGDDPLRAVRTAFDIHAAMTNLSAETGRRLEVHIGIASGEVVAAGVGGENRNEYTVTGDSVNLAARLDEMAARGETLISEAVWRAVSAQVEGTPLGEVRVRGLEAPVRAWRVRGLVTDGQERVQAPFVGRRGELAQFSGVITACRETGCGQAVLVRGEAGMGKTRLVEELTAVARKQGFASHKGLVLDFGVGKGQDAIRALVRSLIGVPVGGDKAARRAAADAAVAEGLLEAERSVFVNDLLDLPQPIELRTIYDAMDNATRNRRKQEVVTTLIGGRSAHRPILLIVEDVHWASALTLDHLAAMTRAVRDCPAVLVMTSRIEGDPLDQTWRGATHGSPLMTIDLGPLRHTEAEELAGGFIDATNRYILDCIERAEGNPLFLEQLLRNAEETGEESVPASIQSLVLSRMDRLSPADKQALQAASVIGQRFSLDALRHLIDDPAYDCAEPIEHYLVRPEGDGFLFAHALIQEGVYSSLLKTRARQLHTRAAEWFAESDVILRAQHLDRAGDPTAPQAYLEAARVQAKAYHFERALELVERGIDIVGGEGERFALAALRGELLHDMGSVTESMAAYREALELATDDTQRCRAWIGLAAGMRMTDEYDDALAALDKAESVATSHGLTLDLGRIHYLRGNLYFPLGKIEGCRTEHELALAFARKAQSPESEARALGGLADAEYARGRMRTAHEYFCRCVELCREQGLGRVEVANQYMIGFSRQFLNELEQALDDGLAAVEAASKVGHHRAELLGLVMIYHALVDMGELDRARQPIEQARILAQRLGAGRFETQNLMYLAKLAEADGDRPKAVELLNESLKISRESGVAFTGPRILGYFALVTDDAQRRREALDEAERLLHRGAVGHNHFWFYRFAMEACLRAGEWDEVDRYAAALEDYTRPEPLPWSDFFIARGRALAAHGRGMRDAATMSELTRLKDAAESVKLRSALPAITQAISAGN